MPVDLHVKSHTLSCDEVVVKIYAYLDGVLSLETVSLYKDHLDNCPPCRGFVEFEAKLINIIKTKGGTASGESIPESLRDKILKAIQISGNPTS